MRASEVEDINIEVWSRKKGAISNYEKQKKVNTIREITFFENREPGQTRKKENLGVGGGRITWWMYNGVGKTT